MKRRLFDFVHDELAWSDERIPISFHRGAACDTHRLQKLHLEPLLVGPFCRPHAQLLGASEFISCIHVLAPAVFHASKHVQATPAERRELLYESSPRKPWLTVYRGRKVFVETLIFSHERI